ARRGFGDRLAALGDASVQVAQKSGKPDDVLYAQVMRGTMLLASTDLDEVETTAVEALGAADAMGAVTVAAAARWLASMVAMFREDVALARQRLGECLRFLSSFGTPTTPFFPAVTMCLPLVPIGSSMIPVFEESWLLGRRVGAVQGHAYALSTLADAHR